MQTDGSSATSDDFRLRLAWDGDDVDDRDGEGRDEDEVGGDPAPVGGGHAPSLSAGRTPDQDPAAPILVALREALDELTGARAEMAALREELRAAVAARPARRRNGSTPAGDVAGELAEEVAALRAEVVSLRRRITLRADGPPELANESAAHLADLIAERLGRRS